MTGGMCQVSYINMNNQNNTKHFKIIIAILAVALATAIAVLLFFTSGVSETNSSRSSDTTANQLRSTYSGYELEQVVVLSRHNIRSPLSGGDSLLGTITPYKWFDWSSSSSELSLRGGALETLMGQYFRKWLESEKLIPDNYMPGEGEVRIYANSKQRTIATARYFSAGFLPVYNEDVEYHMQFDKMDPVFNPVLTFVSDRYVQDAKNQINAMYSDQIKGLKDNYKLISDVIDMKSSSAYKEGKVSDFTTDDLEISLKENAEPSVSGSLKNACTVSDALVLQYYEEKDLRKAAFNHSLTFDEWKAIGQIKDVYGDVLFSAPLVSVNVAHPLLMEINKELKTDNRRFTFLCGHDSNISSVLSALEAEDYNLPQSIEKTPIGCKIVFSRWKNSEGEKFYSIDMVYLNSEQLRNIQLLDMNNPPAVYPISLKGIERNPDGLYGESSVEERLDSAIKAYDHIR